MLLMIRLALATHTLPNLLTLKHLFQLPSSFSEVAAYYFIQNILPFTKLMFLACILLLPNQTRNVLLDGCYSSDIYNVEFFQCIDIIFMLKI